MSRYDNEDFNISEYRRKVRMHRKRVGIGLIIAAIVTLAGMVVLWH